MSHSSHLWRQRITSALPPLEPPPDGAPAAVLLPLVVRDGDLLVWLVRRADSLRHHPGQIGLPGGKRDPSDPDLLATALREAHEEIGLPPSQVDVLGQLSARLTSSRFALTPFVGLVSGDFQPIPQVAEVARVFAAPLAVFLGDGELRVPPTLPERGPVPSYLAEGEVVWGATAAVLARLAALILTPTR